MGYYFAQVGEAQKVNFFNKQTDEVIFGVSCLLESWIAVIFKHQNDILIDSQQTSNRHKIDILGWYRHVGWNATNEV